MKIIDLIYRKTIPDPWAEGDNIPWNEPSFSKRMLREHLSQEHDAASRKYDRIDQHVHWIHQDVLSGTPSKILDLACGPGLYASRLAKLGHQSTGIDYSPASIAYAKKVAADEKLDCQYQEADLRAAAFDTGFDLVLLIYGEFNVFKTSDARLILNKAHKALNPGGRLILEPHTFEAVQQWGEKSPTWYTSEGGLFSSEPYIMMEEFFWDPDQHITTNRYYAVDPISSEVTPYAQSLQAYTQEEYESSLGECGYSEIKFYPSLTGLPDSSQNALLAITAKKS